MKNIPLATELKTLEDNLTSAESLAKKLSENAAHQIGGQMPAVLGRVRAAAEMLSFHKVMLANAPDPAPAPAPATAKN